MKYDGNNAPKENTMPVLCLSPVKLIHVSFKNITVHIINIHCSKRLYCKAHLTQNNVPAISQYQTDKKTY